MSPEQNRTKQVIVIGILVVVGGLLFAIVFWIFSHGQLRLTLPEKTVSVEIYNQTTGELASSGTSNSQTLNRILASGRYEIRAFSEDKQASTYFVTIPRFLGSISKQVILANQRSRNKIARNVEPCILYSNSVLFSFGCSGSDNFYRHYPTTNTSFSRRDNISIGHIISMKPYSNDSFIALRIADEGEIMSGASLVYIQSGQVMKNIDLPQNFISESEDYTLAVDPTSEIIAVGRDKNSEILIFSDISSQPKTLKPDSGAPKNIEFLETSISLYAGRLYYTIGNSSVSPDSEDEDNQRRTQDTVISIYDTGSLKIDSSYATNQTNDSAAACEQNVICFFADGHMRILGFGDKNRVDLRINDVSSFSVGDQGKIYYTQKTTANELGITSGESRAIFSSNRFVPSYISFNPSGIVLTTVLSGSDETHAFLLDKEESATNVFADEKLPYEKGYQGVVQDSDYSGSVFLVKLALSSWTSNRPGSTDFTFDQAEFDRKRGVVLSKFNQDFPDQSMQLFVIP